MAAVDSLADPADLSEEEREAVETLLYRLADDEFVLAERYTEWQVRSPTLESDLALSNIAQDELGHARLWYDLLEDFGYEESELLWERDPATFRHSSLVELPFESGDWADPILRSYLYDEAEHLRLEALEDSSYDRIRDRVGKVQGEENYHREHATSWLERLTETDDGRERVQAAVDRLFPHALTLFEPCAPRDDESRAAEVESRIDDLGIRTRSLEEMGEEWLETVVPFLESLGLETPVSERHEVTEDDLPEARGRDGSHVEEWYDLYDEFTHTYRELGRTKADRIMEDPDDYGQ
ncbi:1,2-phenylacetyl-CoA epoxidase subunit PaaC [Natrononativus amylolyticus]|uniref:1,2-phenylacetyl-CoA epoxidase subunit PaaC n=1 Tax=Natrononativus amylolyticus TaxID=2963434 RepID=UPI0020CF402C|nr:1,2-phenylacetyl-CoA epoxidase subunit PaaC [Natrononativus amylolyticus]